jgi:hypothetical protein
MLDLLHQLHAAGQRLDPLLLLLLLPRLPLRPKHPRQRRLLLPPAVADAGWPVSC